MFLGWSSSKIAQRIEIHTQLRLPWQRKGKSLKIFFSETICRILKIFCRNGLQVTLYQNCPSRVISVKNMAARGRGLFSLYGNIVTLKNLLLVNYQADLIQILPESSFGGPLPKVPKELKSVPNIGCLGNHGFQVSNNFYMTIIATVTMVLR